MKTMTLMEAMVQFPEGKWEMYSPFRPGVQGLFTNDELMEEFGAACEEGVKAFAPDNTVRWEDDGSVHLIRPDGESALFLRLVEPGKIRVSPEHAKEYTKLVIRAAEGEDVEKEMDMLDERIIEENLWRRD